MQFIKTFKLSRGGCKAQLGSLIICNGKLHLRIRQPKAILEEFGFIEGGTGAVISLGHEDKKTPYILKIVPYDPKDIPIELQGQKYRFKIPAEKISDTEYVFMFDKACMLNKK